MGKLQRHSRQRGAILYEPVPPQPPLQISLSIQGQANFAAQLKRGVKLALAAQGQGNYTTAVTVTPSDMSGQNLTVWLRGNSTTEYSPTSWAGTASAGSSGSAAFAHATNSPDAGVATNGHTPADFVRANSDQLTNATALSSIISGSAYFGWVLFYADSITANDPDATAYGNECLIGDTGGFFGVFLTSQTANRVQVYQWDGASKVSSNNISTGTWNLICFRYDGTNMRTKLNSSSVTTTAAGNITTMTGTMSMGTRAGLVFFDGRVMECGLMASAGSDALFDQVRAYVNSRYILSL